MYTYEFSKTITNSTKFMRDITAQPGYGSSYLHHNTKGLDVQISFSRSLNQSEANALNAFVTAFNNISIVDNLREYVNRSIRPFIEELLITIQAENIEMGITQAGKTSEVVGFFTTQILLPGRTRTVSLKDTLDTNSLTVTVELFNWLLANQDQYSDLAPFITPSRITSWRDQIVARLSGG